MKTRERTIRILLRGNSNERRKLSSTYFASDDERMRLSSTSNLRYEVLL